MPNINEITLLELTDQIKREARLKGASDLDDFILSLINELLLTYCENNKYFELLQLNVPIAAVANTGNYNLPQDFQHKSLVRYSDIAGNTRTLFKRNCYVANPAGSVPNYFQIAGNTINIMPFSNVLDGESILLDYYTFPPRLTSPTDLFPIPKLFAPLKQKAVYRALIYNDQLQTASALKSDAQENESRSSPKRNG